MIAACDHLAVAAIQRFIMHIYTDHVMQNHLMIFQCVFALVSNLCRVDCMSPRIPGTELTITRLHTYVVKSSKFSANQCTMFVQHKLHAYEESTIKINCLSSM